jgi:hypothetical protein
MRTLLLPILLLAGCASQWKLVGAEDNPALRPGAQVATFERGRGGSHERRVDVRVDGADVSVTSVDDLMQYARPIDSAAAAVAYSALVRELGVTDAGAHGLLVRPDPTLEGYGSGGRYSGADAAVWRIPFEPTARPNAGGFEVSRVVLVPPGQHPTIPTKVTPWRLLYVREIVFRDGTIRFVDENTITNGADAARFAEH